jgi:hypothetical protein
MTAAADHPFLVGKGFAWLDSEAYQPLGKIRLASATMRVAINADHDRPGQGGVDQGDTGTN